MIFSVSLLAAVLPAIFARVARDASVLSDNAVYTMADVPKVNVHAVTRDARVLPDDGVYTTVKLPKMNNRYLEFNEKVNEAYRPGTFDFGKPVDMSIDLVKDSSKIVAESFLAGREGQFKVYRLAVESDDAFSLNLIFEKFQLPAGAELYLVGEKDIVGPFTQADQQPDGSFATWPMEGSRLIIEAWVPVSVQEAPVMVLETVVHGFRASGSSGTCNIDVACSESKGWENEIRSSAMILTGTGSRFCSGAMINNARQDGRQLFLTANHCVSGSWSKNMLLFNYQRPACNSRSDGPTRDTVLGLELIARYAPSDFALFEVKGKIPEQYNVHLSGFSALDAPLQGANGIHHPSGDVKKFSEFSGELVQSCWQNYCPGKPDHWKIPAWTKGTTEPGSSGSPLYNAEHKIIGQLHGGTASCRNKYGYDIYGGLFASWTGGNGPTDSLERYLDPDHTNTKTISGVDLNTARASAGAVQPLLVQAMEK